MLSFFHESCEGLWIYENEDAFIAKDRDDFFISVLAHREETEIRVWIVFRMYVEIEFRVRMMIGQESECIAEWANSRLTLLD